ncbi:MULTISPECIES: hypothetical protein [Brevibacillus]|uniref:hypothetical protein n=1 Tax=Brevibacillus TaxID=55080 RepID=UPI000D0F3755|nr:MULTISPECIES: hypothetical protein [Brevibacillus]MCM3143467.1 hypothetical protein [Brevibacillus sp. MER 51]MED1944954.1 hypothetical protein [Brevibacillus formosus]MED1996359.1 hypothetical protein [Brevibacillus formosus]MED2081328.1 hypothetical protein [Brevibacillus formosus]PSK19731.1 hypothetical protein C7R94_06360 [Brevibacillus sp. NRRL NRS-603]
MKNKLIVSLAATAIVMVLVFGFLYVGTGNDYYRYSDGPSSEQIEALKSNKIDYMIKEDGSLWIRRSDELKVAQCCT